MTGEMDMQRVTLALRGLTRSRAVVVLLFPKSTRSTAKVHAAVDADFARIVPKRLREIAEVIENGDGENRTQTELKF